MDQWLTEEQWLERWLPLQERARREELELARTRLRGRRVSATVEARRSWNALATREEFLRGHIAMLYRMLGRTDIMSERWMRYRDGTPMSQADIEDARERLRYMIDRDTTEADMLMSWERFNDVIQTYDYQVIEQQEANE
jgi:hypothetical protein